MVEEMGMAIGTGMGTGMGTGRQQQLQGKSNVASTGADSAAVPPCPHDTVRKYSQGGAMISKG